MLDDWNNFSVCKFESRLSFERFLNRSIVNFLVHRVEVRCHATEEAQDEELQACRDPQSSHVSRSILLPEDLEQLNQYMRDQERVGWQGIRDRFWYKSQIEGPAGSDNTRPLGIVAQLTTIR